MKRVLMVVLPGLLVATLAAGYVATAEPKGGTKPEPSQAALDRTRKNVRMLDDVYKSAIVLITDKYVNSEDDYPAGSAAIDLFGMVQKKGWHEVRLIDATGKPYTASNVAKDAFEKEAIEQLKLGKDHVEQVVEKAGKPYLRAVTPVPVVMQKCVMCHAHYAKAKKGEPIGAISYTLPIE